MVGQKVFQGNNFKKTTEGGKPVWYWESAPGSQCGRTIKWKYEVQHGDIVDENAGTCPQGYKWANMTVFGDPQKI